MKKKWLTIGDNQEAIFKALSVNEVLELTAEEVKEYQEEKFRNDMLPFSEKQKALEEKLSKLEEGSEEKTAKEAELNSLKDTVSAMEKHNDMLLVEIKKMKEGGSLGSKESKKGLIEEFLTSEAVVKAMESKTAGWNELSLKAPEVMSIGTTTVSTPSITGANGYSTILGNFVDSQIGMAPKPENFILPLVTVETQVGTENIWWTERNNEEGDAEFIGEGDLKPLVSAKWETFKSDVKEVADFWKMTNRLMNHAPSVVSEFRTHAQELVEQKIDDQLVTGDGIGNNLKGIALCASAFVVPAQLAASYIDANIWDAINAALITVKLANFNPSVVVLNTVWEAKMKSIKATDGTYLVPQFVTPDGKTISGVRVVFTNKLSDAKLLVGDLKKYKVIFSENITFAQGWENDDFKKNMTSFKLEAFLGAYCKSTDAGAIIYDDIATIIAAIDKP